MMNQSYILDACLKQSFLEATFQQLESESFGPLLLKWLHEGSMCTFFKDILESHVFISGE